jgi:hypothetical protein
MNKTMNKSITSKRWLTPTDLQKEYGFGLSSQSKLRSAKKIPFSKMGRYIRYDRFEIDKWIENNKIEMRG